ncbi:MAG TPA: hypothetical protein VJ986_09175 [Gaiellaceae bacterium]|nr:hypothetical protein [Gaiellaceae bacterium]
MRVIPLAAVLCAALLLGGAATAARPGNAAPTGLHAFLLRADETHETTFSQTPSFAWKPVPGALRYEFQLSLSNTFRDNGVIFADLNVTSPVEAPGITLPWISGAPHSLYARVRAITTRGATPWSTRFGFDMTPPPPPTPAPSYPGVLRWTPVEGAVAYQVWLVDANKIVTVTTNVLDEREFYTLHHDAKWIGTVHWRIRAVRNDVRVSGSNGTSRYNKIPAVQYGAWSPVYSSTNPAWAGGKITLLGTLSDVFSDGSPTSPTHRLMPAFLWSGDQTVGGSTAELFRVYVFTDRGCLNPVFVGSVVGGPAYAPRPYGSLELPSSPAGVAAARNAYLADGTEPAGVMADGTVLTPNEDQPHVTRQTTVPGAPGEAGGSTGSTSTAGSTPSSGGSSPAAGTSAGSDDAGAPVDLWDTGWPAGGYYWTVVPVAAVAPDANSTVVAPPGALAGDSTLPVGSSTGFAPGDTLTLGTGSASETVTVGSVADGKLTLAGTLKFAHAPGETVARAGGTLVYRDLELPQDACASGRVSRFGKSSAPALTAGGGLFATGLSSKGRLTSALHTTAFYGQPLVSWIPALGAEAYEVQWSKTRYPFRPATDPSSGGKGFMTATTAAVLPVGPGTWWYRVRGYDFSLPTGVQQMTWSPLAKLVVAKPKFRIAKPKTPKQRFKVVGGSK